MAPSDAKNGQNTTVRKRKLSTLSSTQRFLAIAEIHHDTVVLKNGGLRAVLQVEALNFNLKSETEQQGIIAGYQSFVNSVTFPLQIVVRSSKMNIDPYLERLRAQARVQKNDLLQKQTLSYADFVEKLVDIADIMQKKFFVVVPVDTNIRKKTMIEQFFNWMSPDDTTAHIAQRHREFGPAHTMLKDRVNLIQTGLQNIGLQSRRHSTRELIELFYEIYNPKTSQEQKLPGEGQLKVDKTML